MYLFKFLKSKETLNGNDDIRRKIRRKIFSSKNMEILLKNLKEVKDADVSGLINYIKNNKDGIKDGSRRRKRKSVKRKRKSM